MDKSQLISIALFLFVIQSSMAQGDGISESNKWSERIALSVMKQHPEPWMIDFMEKPVWSYPQGLMLLAFERLWKETGNQKYFDYIKEYADKMIDENGDIYTYNQQTFNIDMINSGKLLFNLYEQTEDPRFLKAIETLRNQLKWQPKTNEGGFWHKLQYPWQMWLDGAYMGTPFLIQYGVEYEESEAIDQGILQLMLLEKYLRDDETGLLYHGYDESRIQKWADAETGRSPHFWGRAIGWYAMALVDALDFIPDQHPQKTEVIEILKRLASAIKNYQDQESKLWYQMVDKGNSGGNYVEASASAMFIYALAKGYNKKYLDQEYQEIAQKGFDGLVSNLIVIDDDGEVHLEKVCAVAGLGGNPYRDGSYDYYVNEAIKTDDPKGVGPLILASIELSR